MKLKPGMIFVKKEGYLLTDGHNEDVILIISYDIDRLFTALGSTGTKFRLSESYCDFFYYVR